MYNWEKGINMTKNIENTRVDKVKYKRIMTDKIKEVLESEKGTDFNHSIFKGYIEKSGAFNLALELNTKGHKVSTLYGSRMWLTTDIREYILNKDNQKNINRDLLEIVVTMIDYTGRASFEQRLFRSMKKVFKL